MGNICHCYEGLSVGSVAPAPVPTTTANSAATSGSLELKEKECSQPAGVAAPLAEQGKSWDVGQGVTDISPSPGSAKLLLRTPPGAPDKAATPSDGARVTLEIEVFELPGGPSDSAPVTCLPRQRVQAVSGTGDVLLPEELEIVIPSLKQGVAYEVLCQQFGEFGSLPAAAPWAELAACLGKTVLFKVELVEAQEICLATLEGHERLEYAKGRKDAGGRYFKRAKYEAALERYSLAAEMLGHIDDIKDSSLNLNAKETRGVCELNAAACLLKMEKWREAEAVCSSLLRQNPDNEKALFRRAKALLAQGQGARAEVDLKKVLEVNSSNTEAKQLLQQARQEAKGTARERKVYAKMLS